MAYGIGIGICANQSGNSIAGDIFAATRLAQSPTQLITAVLGNDATFARLPAPALVDVPTADIREWLLTFIRHREVAYLTAVQVADGDIALRTLRVDTHLAGLNDAGVTVLR